jgi:hypothetical protein
LAYGVRNTKGIDTANISSTAEAYSLTNPGRAAMRSNASGATWAAWTGRCRPSELSGRTTAVTVAKTAQVARNPYSSRSQAVIGAPTRVPTPMPATATATAKVRCLSNQPETAATSGT